MATTLNYEKTKQALLAALDGGVTPILEGPPGCGKCLGVGTPVLLADGRVLPVEQIIVGDLLMGPDGKPREVTSTTVGEGPLYRIDPIKGEPWVCNDAHILTLVNTYSGEVIDTPLDRWLGSGSSFKHDHKLFSVGVDHFYHEAPKLPVDPYFLGVWFGDGAKSLRSLVSGALVLDKVAITKPDPEIRKLCEDTAAQWDLRVKVYDEDRCPTFVLCNEVKNRWAHPNRLLMVMRDLVVNDGTVHIPDAYLRADRNSRLQFLAGFLDADGENHANCFIISQKREDWARAIWFVSRSLGLCATINSRQASCNGKTGTYWVVIISGDTDQIPTRIPRKQPTPRQQKKVATRTGFAAFPVGVGTYYGFTLNGDGRFLLGDFTVTHNTSLSREVAATYRGGTPCHTLIASNCEATDFSGFPYVHEGKLKRALLPEIEAVINDPGVLVLDEYKSVPLNVRAALANVLLERKVQGRSFHPESRVIGCTNPPEQCPAGTESTAMEGNRVIRIPYLPDFREIIGFFSKLGPENSQLRAEAGDFAATLQVETRLVTFDPPREAIDAGAPFASPRAWELGLRAFAAYGGKEDDVGYALLAGVLGEASAAAFLGIRKLRKDMPTVEEITKDPAAARIPEGRDKQIAALGVLSRVADSDAWAAWVYTSRIPTEEIAGACTRMLMLRVTRGNSPWQKKGRDAQVALLSRINKYL